MKKELTRGQKGIVLFTIFWELLVLADANAEYKFSVPVFVSGSIPFALYWSGVWIWGFGYIKRAFGKMGKFAFGQSPISFFFSYEGKINRLEYFGGVFLLNLMNVAIEKFDNIIILLCAFAVFVYSCLALVQKRCRDMGDEGTAVILCMMVGLISKSLIDGLALPDSGAVSLILHILLFPAAGANLYLLFKKGIENPDMKKRNRLLKRPYLAVLVFLIVFFAAFFLIFNIIGTSDDNYKIEEAAGVLYRHTQGYSNICSKYGYAMKFYPVEFKNGIKEEIKIIDAAAKERGYSLDEAIIYLGKSGIADQIDKSVENELYEFGKEWARGQNFAMYDVCVALDSMSDVLLKDNSGHSIIKEVAEKFR